MTFNAMALVELKIISGSLAYIHAFSDFYNNLINFIVQVH